MYGSAEPRVELEEKVASAAVENSKFQRPERGEVEGVRKFLVGVGVGFRGVRDETRENIRSAARPTEGEMVLKSSWGGGGRSERDEFKGTSEASAERAVS